MPYDESFSPEPDVAEAPAQVAEAAAPAQADTATDLPATEAVTTTADAPETPASSDTSALEASIVTDAPEAATPPPAAAAFDEASYLKTALGDTAPATATELKQRFDTLAAKQVTPEQEAQLAILRDPNKIAELAAQVGTKDYDKMEAVEAMRAHFALRYPKLSEAAREHRFQSEFEQKYPTLAAALASPDEFATDDPKLLIEKELADADADENRAALKTAQQERTTQFLASQTAASQPQLTAEQQADIATLPAWLDEAYKDGATIPVDLGDGETINLPVPNAASFKAAFNDTYGLLDRLTLTKPLSEGGVLNRANHALATAFLQDPKAFVQNIAKQVRAGIPEPEPAIPIDNLTNSSASRRPAAKAQPTAAPVAAGEHNQPAGTDADAWLNNNY